MSGSNTGDSASATPDDPDYSVYRNFSGGAIAGIVVGIVVAVVLLGLLLWFIIGRIRRRQRATPLGSIERRARERAIALTRAHPHENASTSSEAGKVLTPDELGMSHLKGHSYSKTENGRSDVEAARGANLSAGQGYAVGLDGRPTPAYAAQTSSLRHADPAADQAEEFRDGEPWPPASLGGRNKRSARRQTQDQPPGQGACAHM